MAAILELAKGLQAKEVAKRVKALEEIGSHGPTANVVGEQLIAAMWDNVAAVRSAASAALERVNPQVHPHLVTILVGTNKLDAIGALGKLGPSAGITVPLLLQCQAERFGTAAIGGVNHGGGDLDEPFPIITTIAPKDKRFAAAVLSSIAAPVVRRKPGGLVTGLEARTAGLRQLNVIDADPADKVKALTAALGDGQIAVDVINALGDCGKSAAPALPLLKKLKLAPDDTIRKAATAAVIRIE